MSGWLRLVLACFISISLFGLSSTTFALQWFAHYHRTRPPTIVKTLSGKKYSLYEENQMANRDGLERIPNDARLKYFQQTGALVRLPQNDRIKIDKRLQNQFRWCRPWVPSFLHSFASDYYSRFHTPLQINSAIRTIAFQSKLQRTNPNAASPYGPTASTHLTGATIDIAKKHMSSYELNWVRNYLLQKVRAYRIHVIEEFHQAVFHIMVGRNYGKAKV